MTESNNFPHMREMKRLRIALSQLTARMNHKSPSKEDMESFRQMAKDINAAMISAHFSGEFERAAEILVEPVSQIYGPTTKDQIVTGFLRDAVNMEIIESM